MISDDFEAKEDFDFAFVDNFNVMWEFSDNSIARSDWETSNENVIDVDSVRGLVMYDGIMMDGMNQRRALLEWGDKGARRVVMRMSERMS